VNRKIEKYLPASLNVLSALAVFILSFLMRYQFPLDIRTAKIAGLVLVYTGMALAAWATFYIKGAVFGMVEETRGILVKNGPYRLVRHPVYLALTVAILGIPVSLGSWPGLVAVFLLFLPTEIYRAKLEDKALALKFGKEWEEYAGKTRFMLPFLGKR